MFCFRRISYCLELHNDAVKAMRYPPADEIFQLKQKKVEEAHRKLMGDGDKPSDKPKDDDKTIDELVKEMDEDDMDM